MSSLPELRLAVYTDEDAAESEDRIEDYLDYLCAPLLGIVPYSERRSLRTEARRHLQDIVEEFEEQGQSRRDALTAALRTHGNPWRIGQSYVQEWSQSPQAPARHSIRRATICAFVWFGIATVLNLLLIELYTFGAGSRLNFTNGYPIPFSYQDALSPYLIVSLALSPFVAGCLTGAMAPHQVLRGIVNALAILAADSLVTACLLLPKIEGFSFVLCQIALWLPIGCVTALATATLRRYNLCQRFWQLAR